MSRNFYPRRNTCGLKTTPFPNCLKLEWMAAFLKTALHYVYHKETELSEIEAGSV
jgi:hypothetical protein